MKRWLLIIFGSIGILVVGFILVDDQLAKRGRADQGLGIELHPDTVLFCSSKSINVRTLEKNQTFVLNIENTNSIGSLKDSLPFPDSKIRVKVLSVGDSSTITNQRIAILQITHLLIGKNEFEFTGYISPDTDRPSDSLKQDGRFLGSFAGMEAGPVGIILGFFLGEKAIASIRRHTDCPYSFIISGLDSETLIPIRVYRETFIPLGVDPKMVPKGKKLL